MKTNILITSAGQRVSLVRAFQKELNKRYPESKVITVDMNPELSPACQIADEFYAICSAKSQEYIYWILDVCEKENVGMVVPTIDTELSILADNKHFFDEKGIKLIISDKIFVDYCRDKRTLNDFFESYDVRFPQPIDKTKPTFPLFIKPYDGSLSKDIFIIREEDELLDYHLSHPKFMFMEYVDPLVYKEYTVDCYYNKSNELCCAVPRERIAVRSGEIHKGITRKNYIVDYVKAKLGVIPGAIGCITFQLFYDDKSNDIIAIEINPRFGGGYPLSYEAGANYPGMLIEEYFQDSEIKYNDNWEDRLMMLRYDAEILVKYNGK